MFKDVFYKKEKFFIGLFLFILMSNLFELFTTGLVDTDIFSIIIFTIVSFLLMFTGKKNISIYIGLLKTESKMRVQKMWDNVMFYSTLFAGSLFFHVFEINLILTIGSFVTLMSYFLLLSQIISIAEFLRDNMEVKNES